MLVSHCARRILRKLPLLWGAFATPILAQAAPAVPVQDSSTPALPNSDSAPPAVQDASVPPSNGSGPPSARGLADIVVTARRRSENVEKVPATIQVLGSATLVEKGIHTENDLQAAVPGLTIRTGDTSSQFNYVLRGESLDAYSGSQPGVQPYVDEVPVPSNSSTILYDLENVQALKGPQGTLFGRNSTGGAVLYQTGAANFDFGGYASAQYGNYDRLIAEGAVNIPIVDQKVALRIAGAYSSGGAFIHNIYDNSYPGAVRTKAGRATLLLKPVNGLTNNTVVQILRESGTNSQFTPYTVIPCGGLGGNNSCTFAPGVPGFESLINGTSGVYPGYPAGNVYPGGVANIINYLKTFPTYTVDANARNTHNARDELVVNTTTFELATSLSIKNIFGYAHSYVANQYDNDGTPYQILQSGSSTDDRGAANSEVRDSHQITDELQLQGKSVDNRLTYIVGLFYVDYKEENNSPITGAYIIPPDIVGAFSVRYHSTAEDRSVAAFAQATYSLTDKLNLTLGGRYSRDKLSLIQAQDSSLNVGLGEQRATESEPSWTASLDYRLTSQLMLYAVTRGSWRAGGYGPFSLPVGQEVTAKDGGNYFPQETVRDVEVGAKFNGSIGAMPFRINVDAYNVWVKNVQKNAYVLVPGLNTIASATVAVPSAKVTGIEGDVTIKPAEWLTFGGTISYVNARFIDNIGYVNGLPAAFGPYGDVPKVSGTAYGMISMPLGGSAGSLNYRADVYAQSPFYYSNTAASLTPGTKLPGYALLDMRLDWVNLLGTKITASLYGKNLGNRLYYTGGAAAALQQAIDNVVFGEPRTFGGQVRINF